MKKINSILLVDDDIDDRDIFREAMSMVDHDIKMEFAVNGLDALQKLQSGQVNPDVIFSDINMPIMNGLQLLEEIRKSSNLNTLPVIIYTTSSSHHFQSQTQLFGAQHYIIKPSCFEKICNEIKIALEKIKNVSVPLSFKQFLSINQLR